MDTQLTLERLLEYVQAAKRVEAVKGHGVNNEENLYHMGAAYAYQDVENLLLRKLRTLDDRS